MNPLREISKLILKKAMTLHYTRFKIDKNTAMPLHYTRLTVVNST